ncbi:hypothetical protein HY994_06070 [Candidatus Micrarchaeota archaeon]|nr:hypothetical protein [Candidatus Micrarchaeota archaeon]
MTMRPSVLVFGFVLVSIFLLSGCLSSGKNPSPTPSTQVAILSIALNESGGISGSFFKSWTLFNGTSTLVQQGKTKSKAVSATEIASLAQYLSDSGFFSKPLAKSNRCADCFAYSGIVQLGGQRRDIQLGGNDVASETLDGLIQRLSELGPVFSTVVTPGAECQMDADCITSGCSGTLCQPKSAPSSITTCEYRNEYACYQSDGCICQSGRCAWSQSTIQCLGDFNKPTGQTDAERACQSSCLQQKAAGVDLTTSPCISNAIISGWVCDVAHSPRNDVIDNDPANTCPAYGSSAKHFVEVDGNCQLIRAA